MDLRTWSKEIITEFINLYKSLPCLWKIKSEEYKNRNLRDRAYEKMIEFCKLRGFPEANRDFVVKKIQSLRGSFRKEVKRVRDIQLSGRAIDDTYVPSLWYYDLLLFTVDQELPTGNVSSVDDSENQDSEEEEVKQEEGTEFLEPNRPIPYMIQEWPQQYVETAPESAMNPKKRKIDNIQADSFEICRETLKTNSQSLSEFDAVGINVSKKLARMTPLQAVYAESLISGIIRRGLLNKLTEETDLCDSGCNFRRASSSFATSSSASQIIQTVRKDGRSD